jgi:hypothetical protein
MSFTFNPQKYSAGRPSSKRTFEPLPEGWYEGRIKDLSVKEWPDGGMSLQVTWEVNDEGFQGRLIWQTLNLKHKDPAKSLKAKYLLADICNAVDSGPITLGPGQPPEKLRNKECSIELILLAPSPPKYPDAKNFLRAVRPVSSDEPGQVPTSGYIPPSSAPPVVELDDDDIPF